MITLDYTTYNPRWKHSGIRYSSWEAFAFALGYLANRLHYRNINDSGLIELHFESNDNQGATASAGSGGTKASPPRLSAPSWRTGSPARTAAGWPAAMPPPTPPAAG